jgi:hypothetical protein
MVAPRLKTVMPENPPHGLVGDALDDPLFDQLSGQLPTVPDRQRPPGLLRQFTGQPYQVYSDRRGKKPAAGRNEADRTAHPSAFLEIVAPSDAHLAGAVPLGGIPG